MILIEPVLIDFLNQTVPVEAVDGWGVAVDNTQLSAVSCGFVQSSPVPTTVNARSGRWVVDVTVFSLDFDSCSRIASDAFSELKDGVGQGLLSQIDVCHVETLPKLVDTASASRSHYAISFSMSFYAHVG